MLVNAAIPGYPDHHAAAGHIWPEDDDLCAVDAIRATADAADLVVDLGDAFGGPLDAGLLTADGLHPTLAGQ